MKNSTKEETIIIKEVEGMEEIEEIENRTIIINSVIDSELLTKCTIPLMEMDEDGTGLPITILINTNGGEIYSGFAFCNVIDKLKTPTTVRILGSAMSMGLLIAMAGYNNPNVTTVCDEFSVGLLHQGFQTIKGSFCEVGSLYDFSRKYEKRSEKYIFSHSTISENFYDTIKKNDTWFDSEDMLHYGIVDKII